MLSGPCRSQRAPALRTRNPAPGRRRRGLAGHGAELAGKLHLDVLTRHPASGILWLSSGVTAATVGDFPRARRLFRGCMRLERGRDSAAGRYANATADGRDRRDLTAAPSADRPLQGAPSTLECCRRNYALLQTRATGGPPREAK